MAIDEPKDFNLPQIDPQKCFEPDENTVILSNKCYKKMLDLLDESLENELEERGTFFYGKKVGNYIIFDMYLTDFEVGKDYLKNGFAKFTAINQNEVAHYSNKKVMLGEQYKYILNLKIRSKSHVDEQGVFKNPDNIDLLTQNDLYACRWLDSRLQPLCGDNVTYLGGVITTENIDQPHIAMIRYNAKKEEFTNVENIGFSVDNKIYRINKKNIKDNSLLEDKDQHQVIYVVKIFNEDKDKKIIL